MLRKMNLPESGKRPLWRNLHGGYDRPLVAVSAPRSRDEPESHGSWSPRPAYARTTKPLQATKARMAGRAAAVAVKMPPTSARELP